MDKRKLLMVVGAALAALVLAVVLITTLGTGGDRESTAAEPKPSSSSSKSPKPSPTSAPATTPAGVTPSVAPPTTPPATTPAEAPAPLPAAQPGIVTGLQCVTIRHTGPSSSQLFANLQEVWASPEKAWNCEAVYGTGPVNDAEGQALATLDPNAQSPYGLTDLYAICATDNDAVLSSVSTQYSPAHAAAALVLCPDHPKAALIQ